MLALNEVLENFDRGEIRYESDEVFKSVVDSLVKGVGLYAVLDHTLRVNAQLKDSLAKCAHRAPTIYMGEEYYPNELETLRALNITQSKEIAELKEYIHLMQKGL